MRACYLCDAEAATWTVGGVLVGDRCAKVHDLSPPAPALAATVAVPIPAEVVFTETGKYSAISRADGAVVACLFETSAIIVALQVKTWRAGGCVWCGRETRAPRTSVWCDDVCWRIMSVNQRDAVRAGVCGLKDAGL